MEELARKIIAFLFFFQKRIVLRRKVKRIITQIDLPLLTDNIKGEYRRLWSIRNTTPDTRWLRLYCGVTGLLDHRYISEDEYYINVEPVLNDRVFGEAYSDKNFYHRFISHKLLPKVWLRNIAGEWYDHNYLPVKMGSDAKDILPASEGSYIVKSAVSSGGGRGVRLLHSGSDDLTLPLLRKNYGKNFVVQEYIRQHPWYSAFNESSVNTIRLFTYRSVSSNEVIALHTILRIGRPGSVVDNQAAGGIACGIRPDGTLTGYGIDKWGKRYEEFNGVYFSQVGKVLMHDEIVSTGVKIASLYCYHRLLAFDFCVDLNGRVRLIEVNNRNIEINFIQMNNGPLFGAYSAEIAAYCNQNPLSFAIDYEIEK